MNAGNHWFKALILNMHAANYLKQLSRYNINFELWYQNTQTILKSIFGINSVEYQRFTRIQFCSKNGNAEPALYRNIYVKGLEESIDFCRDCVQCLSDEETSFDLFANAKECINAASLSDMEKEKIINRLKSMTEALMYPSNSLNSWQQELQQNKIVHLLNKLVCLHTMKSTITGQEGL